MQPDTPALGAAGLALFLALRSDAIDAVTERFYDIHGPVYAQFGQRGRDACRDDLGFHLEFLRPVLEFGLTQPMVDYLRWLASVLATRDIPAEHLGLSLEWLAEFFAAHMEGADGAAVVAALHRIKLRFLASDDALPVQYGMMPKPFPESAAFESALLAGDRGGAISLFDRCLGQGHSLVEAELHLVQSALYSIGRKWQNNEVSVAQEHLATAISQAVMIQGLMKTVVPASNGKRILLACVEGNHHTLGLQMVADAFQLSGWEVQCLGGDVPTRSLIAHLTQYRPHLLGLSVSFAQQLRVVKQIMSLLKPLQDVERPAVIVGGLAVNHFNRLADSLGADGWSPDARSAVASAAALPMPSGPG